MRPTSWIIVLALLAIVAASCLSPPTGREEDQETTGPEAAETPEPSPTQTLAPTPTKPRRARRTPPVSPSPMPTITPTQTLTPTETQLPWLGYAPPTITPATAVPVPVKSIRLPPEIEVFVLLGSDTQAPYRGRTDSLVLAFVNQVYGGLSLVSLPRDLYVYLPGWSMARLNTAYFWGGIDLLGDTLEYNLGVRPHHWALLHLGDFAGLVDELGGIEVPVSDPLPNDCGGIPPGEVHMNGAEALCYVRERNTTSDIDRSQRQIKVLNAIFERLLRLEALSHIQDWYERYQYTIQTDLALGDLLRLAPTALRVQDAGMSVFHISWEQVTPWKIPESGELVLLPQRDNALAVIQRAIDVAYLPKPTSPALELRLATLAATLTPALSETANETPAPNQTSSPGP